MANNIALRRSARHFECQNQVCQIACTSSNVCGQWMLEEKKERTPEENRNDGGPAGLANVTDTKVQLEPKTTSFHQEAYLPVHLFP